MFTKALILKNTVRENLTIHTAQQPVILYYVELLFHMRTTLDDLRTQLSKQARLSLYYELLRSIPSIGEVTAVVILSEIGDINCFQSKKQLIAYAGLDPSVFQSGKFTASNNKISKRGIPFLRKVLYQFAFASVCKRSNGFANPLLGEFYDKMISNGKPPKLAMKTTSAKPLRIIFGIMKTETSFTNS